MTYTKQTWVDGEAGGTPISADRLNHMEGGIASAQFAAHLSAGAMSAITGGPAFAPAASRWAAWHLDPSTGEAVGGTVDVPDEWATVDVVLYWTNAGAGAGDVRWNVVVESPADGADLNVSGAGNLATVTAPAHNVLRVSTIVAGLAVTPASIHNIRVARVAGDAADTHTSDVAVLAVELRKAS